MSPWHLLVFGMAALAAPPRADVGLLVAELVEARSCAGDHFAVVEIRNDTPNTVWLGQYEPLVEVFGRAPMSSLSAKAWVTKERRDSGPSLEGPLYCTCPGCDACEGWMPLAPGQRVLREVELAWKWFPAGTTTPWFEVRLLLATAAEEGASATPHRVSISGAMTVEMVGVAPMEWGGQMYPSYRHDPFDVGLCQVAYP